jgi:hypothetical protein
MPFGDQIADHRHDHLKRIEIPANVLGAMDECLCEKAAKRRVIELASAGSDVPVRKDRICFVICGFYKGRRSFS